MLVDSAELEQGEGREEVVRSPIFASCAILLVERLLGLLEVGCTPLTTASE